MIRSINTSLAKRAAIQTSPYRLRRGQEEIPISVAGDFLIGRATDCQLCLGGGLVSRHHARLRQSEEGLVVEDLGSRNGVLVNQRRIRGPVLLGHGDIIGIGLESFEVVDANVVDRPASLSTMPPPSPAPFGDADVDIPEQPTIRAKLDVLTVREREVLELIVRGHTQREMAEQLHISVKTVETHRARVVEKLKCRTRAELVSYAITAGMLRGK
jgi:DNA-binding CsgD family transcriptional regulator